MASSSCSPRITPTSFWPTHNFLINMEEQSEHYRGNMTRGDNGPPLTPYGHCLHTILQ